MKTDMSLIKEEKEKQEIFEYNGIFYTIIQGKYEVREVFIERVWYILNNLNKNTFEELEKKSKILSNIKILNCKF